MFTPDSNHQPVSSPVGKGVCGAEVNVARKGQRPIEERCNGRRKLNIQDVRVLLATEICLYRVEANSCVEKT